MNRMNRMNRTNHMDDTDDTVNRYSSFRTEQMRRVNALVCHPLYRSWYRLLEQMETDRRFCRHQMPHLLDVARLAWIRSMEENLGIDKEIIYAAAVLHDIGKARQYEEKIPHEIAGEAIAKEILDSLPETDAFTEEEKQMILTAVRGHRRLRENAEPLEKLIYECDKMSRMCFVCPAESECDWSAEKKNMEIMI